MLKYTKNQVYAPKYELVQYNDNDFRLVIVKNCRNKGFEELKQKQFSFNDDEEILRCSLSRTKRRIREIALCNDFKYFATLTINSDFADRFNLQIVQDELRKRLHKIKRKNKDFIFVFITEKHKDGAFHFHGLVNDTFDMYENEFGYLSSKIFDEMGFNSFSIIKDYNKTCNYITKYITKDCVKNENNQIYFCSRGLKKPLVHTLNFIDTNIFDDWFENDFCYIKDFNVNSLDFKQKLELMKNFS